MKLGNGKWETAKFNPRLQVTELGLGTSEADTSLWRVNYEYGELQDNGNVDPTRNTGNIGKQILTVPGTNFVQAYKYDSLYRLTEAKETTGATQNWMQQFGYDRYGNRTSLNQIIGTTQINTTPSIDANKNRFNSGQGFTYDSNGNVTHDIDAVTNHARQFVFNGDHKQIQVKDTTVNQVKGNYFYDGEGKRVKKVVPETNETTVFVYSSGKLVAEYSTNPLPANPTISYTTTDHLGSPRVITNALGEVTSRRDFMPFGEEIFVNVGGRTTALSYGSASDNIRQKFTGYQKDIETSLDFAEARMYENRFGRFTAVDPLLASGKSANPQTFNRYVYCGNSPMILVDPDGKQAGDYYNRRGQYLGSDGKDDGNVYFASEVRRDDQNTWIDKNSIEKTSMSGVVRAMESAIPLRSDPNHAVQTLATGVSNGVSDAATGIPKGIGNSPVVALNGVTWAVANIGVQGLYFQGSNPFAAPLPFSYNNAREASYGSAGSTGFLTGLGVASGAIFGGSSTLSVVPESAPFRFPPIKAGSIGGETAGSRYISVDVRRQAATENPFNFCVYCRQQASDIQFEHAVPFSRGGNSTIENIQRACPFCNQSKGARDFPVNPAPGYEGPFPPPWWNQ